MTICLYKGLTPDRQAHTVRREPTMRPDLDPQSCERRKVARPAARRRIREVRAADLHEEMAEQCFSVPPDPTKTAACWRTSQRAERAIEQSAMREQLKRKESHE